MKVIRITDDRYIFDAGPGVTPERLEQLQDVWRAWWDTEVALPSALFISGSSVPLEYEDQREPSVGKLTDLERKIGLIWEALS